MTTLLKINSSIYSDDGQSSKLANEFVANWRAVEPNTRLEIRDLAQNPVPHLDAVRFGAFLAKPESRSVEQQAIVDFSDSLIDELQRADVIVLGLPMYNFGIPSTLKAYFDHIARSGVTFRYTEKGPIGLLNNKKVYVIAARGGNYAGTPRDTVTSYIKDFLGFIGLNDVEFVYAEGLALGEAPKAQSILQASNTIARLVSAQPQAKAA
jgi:FMN-dependent NADH-azoreductase